MTRGSAAVAAVVAAFTFLPAARAAAQQPADSVALRAGWAAEAQVNSYANGALLRIGRSGFAWLVGFSAQRATYKREEPGYPPVSNGILTGTVRLGGRRYLGRGIVRPYLGIGTIVGATKYGSDARSRAFGGYAEAGASYLLTSHLSIGAATQFWAVRERTEYAAPVGEASTTLWTLSVPGVAVRLGVHF